MVLVERPNVVAEIDELVAALSPHYRLTIPRLEMESGTPNLRAFLDGIGLMHTHLLAVDRWGMPALTFALSEPDRVGSLAVLHSGPAAEQTSEGLINGGGGVGQPLFVALGGAYNDECSGFHISASMADALIHFFSGVVRGIA